MKNQTGRCQCGQIRYRLLAPAVMLYACHCLGCQKQSSSAFGMSLRMKRGDVEIIAGEIRFWETASDTGVSKVCGFCGTCGSRIYHCEGHESRTVNIKAGTLEDTSWLRPLGHIWTKRKQPWVVIGEGVLHCEGQPEDMKAFFGVHES